ncbi:MAG: prolipoprotein diacylglyceryl transferase [Candidatus Cloacimonetes bacterium]|nr:prolipoprotein diacylglyceryl transferase [Candidatus Cloacimonadota bacterium]
MLKFPEINPTIVKIGMFEIRWYGLFYIVGFTIAYIFVKKSYAYKKIKILKEDYENLLFKLMLGVIIGARLGYILFYNMQFYLTHPLEIFAVWQGGMSFHGGALGVIVFGYFFCKKHKYNFYQLADPVMPFVSVALFFGRIGNFINGELWGRVSKVPWAMIFPSDPLGLPRHPSQLYEAFLEGFVLFFITYFMFRKGKTPGLVFWSWIGLYGLFRILVEFVRQPDPQLGHLIGFMTMGQILSSLMIISSLLGIGLILRAKKNEPE